MIRVFIVDDSALVRQVLTQCLESHPNIKVIGQAADPLYAIDKLRRDWPDVLILDIEMPRMDGLTFLRQIMAERPTPTLICSTLTEQGSAVSVEALAAGAVGVFTKARLGLRQSLEQLSAELIRKVEESARARPMALRHSPPAAESGPTTPAVAGVLRTTDRVVALGCSTGGTQALEFILRQLPRDCPGIVIVQHMPEKFTADFARRLDKLCQIEVREARHLDRVHSGLALLAPGGLHMQLKRSGAHYQVEVLDGPPVNRHKPSVDVLFRSVARQAGANTLGIIMTGMGDDGARGLLAMRENGASTVAQDEASCVVFGMPKEAIRLGAAQSVEPLAKLPKLIQHFGDSGRHG
ncbi:chemotaxis response regulator protein-glutamate methylesterase [Pseudomonas gingeri NCPPB 3146 = LMG 5327]|uniref:Protein-glutamate methylesterase/protein-glutamine glutaminase n=2 Tax=Pseudomonas gingeri TaxID=117681 RepID=A0A7Y7Y2H0_9PSED|nr:MULTISPECIES: chemotaxis response regulator protein-glutamate methylesterase [Pseudomonas]NVZ25299.1 chemotaxis response regulator protein-glutamate methylesterase [Pseudomonas gingeri]NWA06825.1 chemotaxis response regulator protein-glutamate methylesterase [Pseudomonas gingeri]NWC15487.1 chemotaxis response regulator protein-glutamate methylesterase [Pseudomonas gingeri]NWE47494.1 chemotaxis response regulator protein-glutamate methylesterase [Pseudomonas gingeri]NWE72545.1 chemotaxis res